MARNALIGSMIHNYEILERIGQGGMGDVYLARHPQIGKKVAIKLLRAGYSENPEVTQRFFHEAKVVDEIHHQNLVDVLDFGQTPLGECYIIMEYLEGEPLSSLIVGEGPLPRELIGHIGLQICSALAAAHSKGIIHRDLKSDNVFLIDRDSTDNFVKLFDFGIAKLLDENLPLLTTDGMTMGTPIYMSPEQALGRPINAQTDIYSLGVLLYYMATRTYPFFDSNPIIVANMQVATPLPPPRDRFSGIDSALEQVIVRCLQKDRAERYGSMLEVAAALGAACGLCVADSFGKKRSLSSQEFAAPLVRSARESSLMMMSSEIIMEAKPSARRPAWWAVSLVLMVLLGFLVVSPLTSGSSKEAVPAQDRGTALAALSPSTLPAATSPSSTRSEPTSLRVAALPDAPLPASQPTPKNTRRPKPPKKPQLVIEQGVTTPKKTPPTITNTEAPPTINPFGS